MKTIAIAVFTAVIGICAFFAVTQDTQRKIKQETAEGPCKVHITYHNPTGPMPTPAQVALAERIDRQLPPLATVSRE